MIWLALGAMTVAATLLLLLPLLRRRGDAAPRTAYDREIYRDQLAELDRDKARGLIGEAEASGARAEIGRRLIAASEQPETRAARTGSARLLVGIAVTAPAVALALYLALGAPRLGGGTRVPANEMSALIAQLAEKMKERPGDQRGWVLLGRSLRSLERFAEAADALGRATALAPDDAALAAEYGETLVFAADGRIAAEARHAFEAAVRADPREPRARYYLGLAEAQAGDNAGALARWRALEADSPPDAPWRALLADRIAKLAGESDMVRGMVDSLARRLEQNPDDADGWYRLARAYLVLKDPDKARAALDRAIALRPDDPQAKTLADELTKK